MRWTSGSALLVLALAISGCGPAPQGDRGSTAQQTRGEPAQEAAADALLEAPAGVAVTAAPGVAFNYRYAFSLPAERISAAQEDHAASCEKLGIARCRITGLRYQLLGEGRIVAMLAF